MLAVKTLEDIVQKTQTGCRGGGEADTSGEAGAGQVQARNVQGVNTG